MSDLAGRLKRAINGPDHRADGHRPAVLHARLQTLRPQPIEALDRGIRVERRYARYVNGDVDAGVDVVRAR